MELFQCVIYVFLIGIGSHFLGQMLPRSWFDYTRFPFRSFRWERGGRVYHKLNIRQWKDKLPDASQVVKTMYRKQVNTHPNAENLHRLVEETCVAEFIHALLIILSLGVVEIWEGISGWICWGLCVVGNLPFILIQRFNRPRLLIALERFSDKKVAQ